MTTAKKKYSLVLVFLMICAFLLGMGLSSHIAQAAPEEKTIRIAHISDMHVMIEEYCNVYSDKYIAESKVTKLLEETQTISEAVFQDIYNMGDNAPMYIFITGDITSNGEYENHVWLSKLYKEFTKKMRARAGFEGFQIFLSPGNHDLYNTKAKSFMPTAEEMNACSNVAELRTLLENYSTRSVPSITSKQFMDLYSDFGYCSCPDRKNGNHLASCGMAPGCKLEYFFESDYWYDNATSRDDEASLTVRDPSKSTIDAFKSSDKDYTIYNPDARFGACSYIARTSDFDVITFDSNTRAYKYEDWKKEPTDSAIYSCGGWHETTGGMVSEDQLRWAVSAVKTDAKNNKPVFALGHTNFLPHFDSEDEVISLFTYDNWEEAAYTLADNGIRYAFSGHQHASDIKSYVTQKGNVFYDVETGSLASYGCSWRTMELKINKGADGSYTEDFESLTHNLNYAPFEYGAYVLVTDITEPLYVDPVDLFRGSETTLMPHHYACCDFLALDRRVTKDKATGENLGISDYLAAQMYNMAGSLEYGIAGEYVGENIYDLLGGLTGKLASMPYVQAIASELINKLGTIDLCKFSFEGNSYTVGAAPQKGYHLSDFTLDVANYLLQYDFSGSANKKLTLAKAFLVVYGGHLSGAHTDVMDEEIAPLIDMLKSGRFVSGLVTLLENALLPQLESLLDAPIRFDESTPELTVPGFDLTDALKTARSGFVDTVVGMLVDEGTVFKNVKNGYSSLRLFLTDLNDVLVDLFITDTDDIENSDIENVAILARPVISKTSFAPYVDKYLPKVTKYLSRVTAGESLRSVVDSELVNKYVTDAFCVNLGTYGANILLDMNIDDTDDGSRWIEGDRYTRFPVENYKHVLTVKNEDGTVAFGGHTYIAGTPLTVTPSAENGLLANMISVSFNEDVYTEKKIVWFTAEQVDVFDKDENGDYRYALADSYIRYSTSEDMSDAVTVKATSENVDQVLPTIDLGIIFINMNHVYKNYNRFTVNLSGLTEGTTYYYQLGKDGAWTKTFRFATASKGEFSFMAIADIQGSVEENYIASLPSMQKALVCIGGDPAFIMSAGDNVDNGKNILQYTWLLNHHQEVYANNTFVTTAGNHEKSAHALDNVIALPDNAKITGETGYYYSFDYGKAHFIVLNTNDLDEDNCLSLKQSDWLIDDLESNAKNEETKWTVVLLHKGPYTAGSHAFDDDVIALRHQLASIFEENNVDLVLQGHDHTYSVSEFIGREGNKVTSYTGGVMYKPEGVLYVNLGTMGDKFYDYIYSDEVDLADRTNAPAGLEKYFTSENNLELKETPVFAYVTVSDESLTLNTYTIVDGNVVAVDSVVITTVLPAKEKGALSPAAIAGIAAGCVVVAGGITALVIILIKKKRGK